MFSSVPGPIGIFDSGYGGLTIFDKIRAAMPLACHVSLYFHSISSYSKKRPAMDRFMTFWNFDMLPAYPFYKTP